MKPPVEAPTSTATRPAGSSPSASRAPASLTAPRPTCCGPGTTSTTDPSRTAVPALVAGAPSTRTRPAITRAWAFSRESARPWSYEPDVEARSLGRGLGAHVRLVTIRSAIPASDRGARPERSEGVLGLGEQVAGHGAGALEAVDAHVGRLPGRACPCRRSCPSCSAPSVASRTSSTTWKARPMADA